MTQAEIPLSGGNVNAAVMRVGDTVRRNAPPAVTTVHRLLLHLETRGFQGSPRFLGIDAQGREITRFIAGETGVPVTIWQHDAPLIAAARLAETVS